MKKNILKKCISALAALLICAGNAGYTNFHASAADAQNPRVTVDINANDGRKASYSTNTDNWIVAGGASSEAEFNGVKFRLSNGGNTGGDIRSVNCKILQLQSGIYPYLTMDGVTIKDGDNGGVIKLEISGLSAGTHSIKTWHSCVDNADSGSVSVSVDGKTTASGVSCPTRVTDENNAGIAYSVFEAKANQTVTVLISSDKNGTQNNAWLNGFEIDGADPFNGISEISPSDKNNHVNIEDGISWKAGKNALSHNVYIGTDYNKVLSADTSSPEFRGNQTASSYALDDSYSSLNTYYWRVDEVNADGIVKGDVYSFMVNRLAFPTAEGYGRFARGGRGGRIVEVTNLNDSGEGSLRQALEVEKGARIVVFRVGGVIELQSQLCIPDDGGDVYVAGQTAPGDGITLINYDFGALGSSDVIIRDIRVRVGDMNGKSTGGMGLGSCNNSIIDHCSISWATDEGFSSRSAQNISFQWNIIGESLHDSVHYDGSSRDNTETHAFAASISGYTGSFHHNLLIDCTGRNWSLAGAMEQDAKTYGGQLDIRNNVVYNWKDRTTDGGARRLNFVGNYYKAGAESNESLHIVSTDGNELGTYDMQKMYVSGNKMVGYDGTVLLDSSDNAWDKGRAKSGGKNSTDADVRSDVPFFESYVNTQSADDAYKSVISYAGAGAVSPSGWDYIDSRYIDEVKNNKYTYTGSKQGLKGIIDSQNDAGGYPNSSNFKGSTAPADSDHDGMPDDWEKAHGLDPNDASDGNKITLSADDYTNVEMYLNELAGDNVDYNGNSSSDSAFETIEAEDFDSQQGVRTEDCSEGGQNVGYIENGDYIMFENIDFADGASGFSARTAGKGNCARIEIYIDDMNGSPVGICGLSASGSWQEWTDSVCSIRKTEGVHNVYLKFVGGSGYLLNINNFVFTKDKVSDKIMLGDLNFSGKADIYDYVVMAENIVNLKKSPSKITAASDLNSDGTVNVADILALKQFLLGVSDKSSIGTYTDYQED